MMDPLPLYEGQLPVAQTALYTVPSGKWALIKHINVIQVGAGDHIFIIYKKRSGGTSREIKNVSFKQHYHWDGKMTLVLAAGDAIEGQSSDGATLFDCVISGTEAPVIQTA